VLARASQRTERSWCGAEELSRSKCNIICATRADEPNGVLVFRTKRTMHPARNEEYGCTYMGCIVCGFSAAFSFDELLFVRLTARVSGGQGAGVGKRLGAGKTRSQKKPCKSRRLPAVRCTLCWAHFSSI
jgi:hypothetical protein